MTILEYMRSIEPSYPSQQHQRAFLARMAEAERLNPCTRDHSTTTPPCHVTSCYPQDEAGRMVGS